jgi:hypothetical protein
VGVEVLADQALDPEGKVDERRRTVPAGLFEVRA